MPLAVRIGSTGRGAIVPWRHTGEAQRRGLEGRDPALADRRTGAARAFLAGLYLLGIVHWVCFFYLVYPESGDRGLMKMWRAPKDLLESRAFSANDWSKEVRFQAVIQEALRTRTVPYHMPHLAMLASQPRLQERFLGYPNWTMSPQILLLSVLDPYTFSVVNLLLMYTVGFFGCLLLRRRYGLGPIAFTALFLLYQFNGYFVEKIAAYGSGQYGYFLMPFLVLVMFRAAEPDTAEPRGQRRGGILLGLILAGILFQGSFHLFVECVTFVLIWGLANVRRWMVWLIAFVTAGATAAIRLVPVAVAFGPSANPHAVWGGYPHPEWLVEGLVLTRTQLSPPAFTWWEFSLYVSVVGFLLLVYFGLWGPFLQARWVRFHGWRALALPCLVLLVISLGQWKRYLIPNWIPLLNAESLTSRYMIIPLVVVMVIAAINLQGFVERYRGRTRVRVLLLAALALLAAFLLNHSRLWRMHKVQVEVDRAMAAGLYHDPVLQVVPRIQNDPGDRVYRASFWVGLAMTGVTLTLIGTWGIKEWLSRNSAGRLGPVPP